MDDKQQERLDSFNSQLNDWNQANDKYLLNKSTNASRLADFRLIKERGFPNESIPDNTNHYFEYDFEVECLIPIELSPGHDPNFDLPLPIPDRELTVAEKFAALSALYDAHWKSAKKIAPWGTMPDEAEVRSGLPHDRVENKQSYQASWY